MKKRCDHTSLKNLTCLVLLTCLLIVAATFPLEVSVAEDTTAHYYTTKYRNVFTKSNLDTICNDYNIKNGKYWCVKENVLQTFKGIDQKGATRGGDDSGKNADAALGYYGCVWPGTVANADNYNDWIHYGTDCDGFCKFIGYLLTGSLDYTTDSELWNRYRKSDEICAIDAAGGLKTGDMIFSSGHVAVVYTVSATEVTVMECWGSQNNQLSVGNGFNGRSTNKPLSQLKNIIIDVCRAKANDKSDDQSPQPTPTVIVTLRSGSTWAGNSSKNNGYPTGMLNKGKNFGLRGIIDASEKITSATGAVLNLNSQSENALTPVTVHPNSASLDIRYSDINNKLTFEKLGNGAFAYVVSVITESGHQEKVLTSIFTVGSGILPEIIQVPQELLGITAFVDHGTGVKEVAVTDLLGIKPLLIGDVNQDDVIDGRDVIRLMKWLAGEESTEISRQNSDINQDGLVDERDLLNLMSILQD